MRMRKVEAAQYCRDSGGKQPESLAGSLSACIGRFGLDTVTPSLAVAHDSMSSWSDTYSQDASDIGRERKSRMSKASAFPSAGVVYDANQQLHAATHGRNPSV